MWNDAEIDMEELEARLYCQVHHPANEDTDLPISNVTTNVDKDSSRKKINRYYDASKKPPYHPRTNHQKYQKRFNDGPAYFQAGQHNGPSGQHNGQSGQHNGPSGQHNGPYSCSGNFYQRMGLFTLPNFVLNPCVNNIVVLPTPPTQIFNQQQSPEQAFLDRNREKKVRKRARRRRACKKQKKKFETFKEHCMINKLIRKMDNENAKNEIVDVTPNTPNTAQVEIICLSETDNSDCEIKEQPGAVLVVSSDDDTDLKSSGVNAVDEIKNEATNVVTKSTCEKQLDKESNQICESFVDSDKPSPSACEDDEVILVEPQSEIITIMCEDESQQPLNQTTEIVAEAKNTLSTLSLNLSNVSGAMTGTVEEHVELLGTPESTNDFLDNSFSMPHNSSDVDLDISSSDAQKSCLEVYETGSSCSTSDVDIRPRTAMFTEQEFDVPKAMFSELNLDSFTHYIEAKGKTSNITSILTPPGKRGSKNLADTSKRSLEVRNSSDSSSESDYEDGKVTLVKNNLKTHKVVASKSRASLSSESDYCIVDDDSCNKVENNSPVQPNLPNLSPITSDDEVTLVERVKLTKRQKKKQMKAKDKDSPENPRVSGEKRKLIQQMKADILEIKKMKQSEDDANQKQTSDSTNKFFSTSDEYLEIQVTPKVNTKSSCNSSADIELLNIERTTTYTKQQEAPTSTDKKRFSDYWSEDMKNFYGESWGHEHFNVEEEQNAMSDNPRMWKIIPADQVNINSLPRGPRCRRCREFGHKTMNCRKRIEAPKCILCGASGHYDSRCPNQVCTSCGRRSQYSTTYCSKCARSRHVICRICSRSGHTSSFCTDLWRRYHLTTKAGPLKQPINCNPKSIYDQWCSGCASRGHFEHNCNYYNRTHAPADPFIYSYDDVYETARRSAEHSGGQPRGPNENYSDQNARINPLNFSIPPNSESSYTFNRGFEPNFVQNRVSCSLTPNFYQQFPVFQSIPNVYTLQNNLADFVNPNSSIMSTNEGSRGVQHTHSTDEIVSPGTSSVPPQNKFCDTPSVHNVNDEKSDGNPSAIKGSEVAKKNGQTKLESGTVSVLPSSSAKQKKKNCNFQSQFPIPDIYKLFEQKGIDFLQKLSNDTNTQIKVIKGKKKGKKKQKNLVYVEGSNKMVVPQIEKLIENYCKAPTHIMSLFPGSDFSVSNLKQSLSGLHNPSVSWLQQSRKLYKKIITWEKQLQVLKWDSRLRKFCTKIKRKLECRYVSLNAVLLGKLNNKEGAKHMAVLNQWRKADDKKTMNPDKLRESYNYVFNNCQRLNIDYKDNISRLPHDPAVEMEIENLFKFGTAMCCNMVDALQKLKLAHNEVVDSNYDPTCIRRFKRVCNKLNTK